MVCPFAIRTKKLVRKVIPLPFMPVKMDVEKGVNVQNIMLYEQPESDKVCIEERQDELKRDLEGVKEQYYLIAYKYPVARFGAKELEENTTITLYEDTHIIKMTVAEESIKAFSIPEEFLTFYYELSEEEINFYHSLVE